jgi:hypothetical protein
MELLVTRHKRRSQRRDSPRPVLGSQLPNMVNRDALAALKMPDATWRQRSEKRPKSAKAQKWMVL